MFHATGGPGGSLVFVRVVAITIAMPIRMMHPTITQVCETPTRIAAIAKPMIRTMNPIRYVLNEDMTLSFDFRGRESSKSRAELHSTEDYRPGAASGAADSFGLFSEDYRLGATG